MSFEEIDKENENNVEDSINFKEINITFKNSDNIMQNFSCNIEDDIENKINETCIEKNYDEKTKEILFYLVYEEINKKTNLLQNFVEEEEEKEKPSLSNTKKTIKKSKSKPNEIRWKNQTKKYLKKGLDQYTLGENMYKREMDRKEKNEKRYNDKREEIKRNNQEIFTFKPSISKNSRKLVESKSFCCKHIEDKLLEKHKKYEKDRLKKIIKKNWIMMNLIL